ncbi:MAG: S9 family peptidase [Chloroflexi bacterium]|nr:S9 family peptidase [Chloroflexota bacterium]
MTYRFEQFLNARSVYGPTVDGSGRRLYFLSDLTGVPALWSLPLGEEGAWPEPLVVNLDRAQAAYPSRLPGRLIVAADVGGAERTQLFLLDRPGELPVPLTDDPETIHLFGSWHPDNKTIALSTNRRDPRCFDVELLNVETGARRVLWQTDGSSYASQFSPDGQRLLVRRLDTPSEQTVFILDVQTGGVTRLTPGGTPAVYENLTWTEDGRQILAISDVGREFLALVAFDAETGQLVPRLTPACDVDAFALSPNGEQLIYTLNRGGISEVRLRELADGGDRKIDLPAGQAHDGYRWVPTFSWLPDSSAALFAFSEPTCPPDIFSVSVATARASQVTSAWRAGLAVAELAPAELIEYPTFDGRTIPAFVFSPPDAPRDGTGAAVFFVHGGPESQTRAVFNPVIQFLANRGLTVIAPNVRGSSGYGKTYLKLDDVEKRMDSVKDLAAGAAWAVQAGLAHPKRIGVMGGSYGGFMVLAALTEHPELWAAGVDIVGIANFVTFMERTGPWRRRLREAEYGSLEHHYDFLVSISPIHKADRIVAPLFVVHGANDPRVPIHEAEQLVAKLTELGRPVEYHRYENEGHGLAKLPNKLDAYPKIADFLERALGAQPG